MDIQIKSSRSVLATDSAVKKLVELKAEESSEDSFLRMGVKPGGFSSHMMVLILVLTHKALNI